MKFDTGCCISNAPLEVGNVYPVQGKQSGTYWLVVGIFEKSVSVLRIDANGQVVGAQTYGTHVFDGSNQHFKRSEMLLGTCEGLKDLTLVINWNKGTAK